MIDGAFDQIGTVYTANVTTGRFNVLAKSNLACRLLHISLRPATTGPDRAELASKRDLIFDPLYAMPEQCQVLVDNVMWAPEAGTFGSFRDWDSTVVYKNCIVVRQQTSSF